MKLFITGGSGFVGRNLKEHLSTRHQVLAPTHSELELTDEDAVRDFFNKNPIDVVVHSAVRPGHRNAKDPSNQLLNNTRMFFNIVRNSDRFGKMIFLSSGLVYDIRCYKPKMKEEYFDSHVPVDEGGFSKYIAAKYVESAHNMIELRPFGVFGKYEDYAIRFISNMICKAVFDLPLTIKQNRRFDYVYIDDLVAVIDYFIENKGKYKSYNVTPDESVELLTIAEKILGISGKQLPIRISEDGLGTEYSGDNARLKEEIPELRLTPIDEAIERLYSWYYDNRHLIDRNLLMRDK